MASDISTFLPCNENDFSDGREPKTREALDDTSRQSASPGHVADPGRSLFASLVKIRHHWGIISRQFVDLKPDMHSLDPHSDFTNAVGRLEWWEQGLPEDHRWNPILMRRYRNMGQDVVSPAAFFFWQKQVRLTSPRHIWK